MNIKDLQAEINATYQEAAQIDSSGMKDIVKKRLNIIERLAGGNEIQTIELQKLRDEINRSNYSRNGRGFVGCMMDDSIKNFILPRQENQAWKQNL